MIDLLSWLLAHLFALLTVLFIAVALVGGFNAFLNIPDPCENFTVKQYEEKNVPIHCVNELTKESTT